MRLFYRVLLILLVAVAGLIALVVYFTANPHLPAYKAPQQLHYQDQLSPADRQTYYYTPQGTQVKGLRYNWFSALELPFSQQPFAAPEYLARFGFLVEPQQKASAANTMINAALLICDSSGAARPHPHSIAFRGNLSRPRNPVNPRNYQPFPSALQ